MQEQEIKKSELKKACANCGAEMKYKPGSDQIKCDYCGYEEFIEQSKNSFEELELNHYLNLVGNKAHTDTISLLQCKNCGANQHVEENYKSLHCAYCSEPLILEDVQEEGWILPEALIPFQFDQKKAGQIFKNWVGRIWFAPNKLKKAALNPEGLHGLYVPYWTFDCNLFSTYQGMRGDYYYVTQRVKTSKGWQTRQVRKTRWIPASGQVSGFIDDILINASEKKRREIPAKISHWDIKELIPFNQKYLAGFITEKYTISLKDGHHLSFQKAKDIAHNWIRRDIGGDTQRITYTDIKLSDETFKHILLPVYISAYRYNNKEYHFYINGQTEQISGKYPISFWKVFFLVLFVILIITLIAVFAK
ncbi:DNA helicase PriA [Leptobacterium flavescens]|uniref:DNA helicase PriA n=1 Tax=Leptobacterium flavescens TaxID=472055 RepID=A0A6P0UPG7_9FLAO|nr:DNA helicase PriA [Leptobacterium flavescens]NER14382.1 DNA helicase PriA [Leptobacterium flavescens]